MRADISTQKIDNSLIDDRLKGLFSDLKSAYEPADGQQGNERNAKKPSEASSMREDEFAACPYHCKCSHGSAGVKSPDIKKKRTEITLFYGSNGTICRG